MTRRERYAHRIAARLCVDCRAGLQPLDGVCCIECAAARTAKHAKYRASPGYLAKHARHEAIRYARRVAVATCLSCPLPSAPGRRRCVGCLATYAAHQQVYEMRREERQEARA